MVEVVGVVVVGVVVVVIVEVVVVFFLCRISTIHVLMNAE